MSNSSCKMLGPIQISREKIWIIKLCKKESNKINYHKRLTLKNKRLRICKKCWMLRIRSLMMLIRSMSRNVTNTWFWKIKFKTLESRCLNNKSKIRKFKMKQMNYWNHQWKKTSQNNKMNLNKTSNSMNRGFSSCRKVREMQKRM